MPRARAHVQPGLSETHATDVRNANFQRWSPDIGCGLLINAILLMNAFAWPFPPMGGLVMFAISWNLFAFFAQFARWNKAAGRVLPGLTRRRSAESQLYGS